MREKETEPVEPPAHHQLLIVTVVVFFALGLIAGLLIWMTQ